jgi:hypothetical protein
MRPESGNCLARIKLMTKKKVSRDVDCSYYRADKDIRLICAGATADMRSVNLVFHDREKLLKYRRTHCNRNCDGCFLKEALDKLEKMLS